MGIDWDSVQALEEAREKEKQEKTTTQSKQKATESDATADEVTKIPVRMNINKEAWDLVRTYARERGGLPLNIAAAFLIQEGFETYKWAKENQSAIFRLRYTG